MSLSHKVILGSFEFIIARSSDFSVNLYLCMNIKLLNLEPVESGPEVITCSTQLRSKFILLINVKMPTIIVCWHINIYEQDI